MDETWRVDSQAGQVDGQYGIALSKTTQRAFDL